ncbi:cell division protein FtsZ [Halorubellus sp. PRR65]|uniref:cell division protein FtsZ n=1 Tax=Halorubellus sp. PRR65 TaxID=3098148 RepID=UPI002B261EF3|nr:cell division protein FtsZ [Halorubellus sp. PRR65]
MTARDGWERDTLEAHIAHEHRDEPKSVEQVYPDLYEPIFVEERYWSDEDDEAEDEPPTTGSTDQRSTGTDDLSGSAVGKKWFMLGVGGAGNHIVDAVLLRRNTLSEENEDRVHIWDAGLADASILNTNVAEIEETYYAQAEKGYNRHDIVANCIIGQGAHNYAGAGHRWDHGRDFALADFEDEGNPFNERWDSSPVDLRDSQAIMFIHSVTKGTGCGSTPVIADKLRDRVLEDDMVVGKPIFSSVVIPSEYASQSGRAKVNGVLGMARMAESVDAIIPFDNRKLRDATQDIQPRIHDIERYNPPEYTDLNKPLVSFLEAFTMSSIPQVLNQDVDLSIRGEVFDPADSFRPVQDKYPFDPEREVDPAVVLAPVLGKIHASSFDRSKVQMLARKALFQNKLADFDPTTAWGGTFLVYGPEEKMASLAPLLDDGVLRDVLGGPDFLDRESTSGVETVDINTHRLVTPYLDDVYLWGTLWNPEMQSLSEMYEHALTMKQDGNTRLAAGIRDEWEHVEALFDCLGREKMP